MDYEIKHINQNRRVIVSLLYILIPILIGVPFILLNSFSSNVAIIFVFVAFLSFFIGIIIFITWRSKKTVFHLSNEMLKVGNLKIKLSEISSARIIKKDDRHDDFKIEINNKRKIKFTRLKKYNKVDDFQGFMDAFKQRMNLINQNRNKVVVPEEISYWDTKTGNIAGYTGIVFLVLTSVLLYYTDFSLKIMGPYFSLYGVIIPFIIHLRNKKKKSRELSNFKR